MKEKKKTNRSIKKKPYPKTQKELRAKQLKLDVEEVELIQRSHKDRIKTRIFVNEYLKDFNGTRAAQKAGYSKNKASAGTIAHRLLKDVEIQKLINARIKARMRTLELDQEYVLEGLIVNHEKAAQAEAVVDANGDPTGEYKFNAAGANKALELLGKHMGMFPTTLRNDPENPIESDKTIIYLPENGR